MVRRDKGVGKSDLPTTCCLSNACVFILCLFLFLVSKALYPTNNPAPATLITTVDVVQGCRPIQLADLLSKVKWGGGGGGGGGGGTWKSPKLGRCISGKVGMPGP
jgi:hypothetical protein